jgi:PAS domain S-box-containing protein
MPESKLRSYIRRGSFYKAVVEDGSDIIFVVDFSGNILYHNASVRETLGYRSGSLLGKNFFDYILPQELGEFKKQFKISLKKKYNEKVEFQFLCKDKRYRFLEFNSINLKYKEKINGLILDCRDITQRKHDAAELLRLQKAKEQFLANISHEIRTPINGIAGMATLLSSEQNPEERQTYLNAVRHSAENLKVIINDILDLAAIESGKLKFEKVPFNLVDLLPSIISTFKYQAKEKRISLEYAIDDKANRILIGDPVRLNQVLINLIGNAVKFTHSGSILVSGNIIKEQKGTSWVEISVADTGVGIPSEKLTSIFDSFSQADESVTRKFGGTGLGLTIVKQLVEMQKGSITVNSKENLGSVFTITIPFTTGTKKHLQQSDIQRSQQQLKTRQQPLNILLVEDNDINRLYAQSILRNWNCKSDTAENGLVAIERLKSTVYDVVLMDIQMPVMDGYEATKAIRMMPSPVNAVPIIALTANATKKDVNKCLAAGMNDYLAKPFTPEDLFHKLFNDLKLKARKEKSLIDLSYLKKASGNNQAFIDEMLLTFINTLPSLLKEINSASKKSDWVKTARIVHQLKPSITLLGIHSLKHQAQEIEDSLRKYPSGKNLPSEIRTTLKDFVTLLEQVLQELQANQLPSASR